MGRSATSSEVLEGFLRRLLVDCMIEQTKAYWTDRAETFERARSQPGDWTGVATPEQIAGHDARLSEIALACRNAATLCDDRDFRAHISGLYDEVLGEVA